MSSGFSARVRGTEKKFEKFLVRYCKKEMYFVSLHIEKEVKQ